MMQGFLGMLKAMGLDPEQLQKLVEDNFGAQLDEVRKFVTNEFDMSHGRMQGIEDEIAQLRASLGSIHDTLMKIPGVDHVPPAMAEEMGVKELVVDWNPDGQSGQMEPNGPNPHYIDPNTTQQEGG
jgi:hypothetical protein